jgi:hypothetical protein
MKPLTTRVRTRRLLLWAIPLALAMSVPLAAQETAPATASADASASPAPGISPEAQAVLDRMTAHLQSLKSFSIETDASRDEVVAYGYKLQNNEHSFITVQRPNKLRAEVSGDIRNRTFVYDSGKLTMYSPDDAVYVLVDAPDTIGGMIGNLLDAGVEMPLIDVLYQATAGTLTEGARSGILVGTSKIDGAACDQLAFRQANVDWQLWVEQGDRPLPRKVVITTRFEVGDPQYQATLHWNLKPKIHSATFVFAPPKGATAIAFDTSATSVVDAP